MRRTPSRALTRCTLAVSVAGTTLLVPSAVAAAGDTLVVRSGGTALAETTRVSKLVIEDGGSIDVPAGKRLSITVNGVETAQRYYSGLASVIEPDLVPGTYRGSVVLAVTDATDFAFQGVSWPFRQALYVGADGIEPSKSVESNVRGGEHDDDHAAGVSVTSTGDGYNAITVDGRDYEISGSTFRATGQGRHDFVGMGATIRTSGSDARVVVDEVDIHNTGALRTGILATDGSSLVVKDSDINTQGSDLPADYVFSPPPNMRQAPWMLGIVGNVRATNMLGEGTEATYINSDVHSSEWGALSTDGTSNSQLTAINSRLSTGEEGYGSYADGQSVVTEFYGTDFDVDDYAVISTGGDIELHDSSAEHVSALDQQLDLRLTDAERAAIPSRATTVRSERFGIMWHGGGSPDIDAGTTTIDGGTRIRTGGTAFQNKGHRLRLDIDGSDGASVVSDTGVVFQLMEADDPGFSATAVYHDPTDAIVKDESFDVTAAHETDSITNLRDIAIEGDFYNGLRNTSKNLVLNLDDANIDGVISSSTAKHRVDAISMANYKEIGEVENVVSAPVNNGVVVDLAGTSTWTVAGESHLSSLTVGSAASVSAPEGKRLVMTVDGVVTPVAPGQTYRGDIALVVGDKHRPATTIRVQSTNYGEAAAVAVDVDDATGRVSLGTASGTQSAELVAGTATFRLPHDMAPGEHLVTASYAGNADAAASKAFAVLRVRRAVVERLRTRIAVRPTSTRVGRLRVSLRTPRTLAAPSGKVRVKLTHHGERRFVEGVVRDNVVRLRIPALVRGRWLAVVRYSGDDHYRADSARTTIVVRR